MNTGAATPSEATRRYLWSLLDALRTAGDSRTPPDVALALDAAKWYAERTGRVLPETLSIAIDQDIGLPAEVSATQCAWLEAATEQEIRRYLPTLAREFAVSVRTGENLSSPSITGVAITAALARIGRGTGPLTFLDLAVGAGTTLLSAAQAAADLGYSPIVLAQDLNSEVMLFATATMFLGGVDSQVHLGDSLLVDPYADVQVDIAVSQPPFGVGWGRQEDEVRYLHRSADWYRWGLPQKSDATWLFASRLIEKLRSPEDGGGRAVMFMAPGSLKGHGADNDIRRAVLEDDLVEAIIALPGRLSPLTDILLYALVFANQEAGEPPGKNPGRQSSSVLRDLPRTAERASRIDAGGVRRSRLRASFGEPAGR